MAGIYDILCKFDGVGLPAPWRRFVPFKMCDMPGCVWCGSVAVDPPNVLRRVVDPAFRRSHSCFVYVWMEVDFRGVFKGVILREDSICNVCNVVPMPLAQDFMATFGDDEKVRCEEFMRFLKFEALPVLFAYWGVIVTQMRI